MGKRETVKAAVVDGVSRFDGASKAAEEIKTRLSRPSLAEKGKGSPPPGGTLGELSSWTRRHNRRRLYD